MDLDAWRAQLLKGAAELAVLAVLGRGDTYGLQLLERIQAQSGLGLSEGSIYPLLNRLQKEGKIAGRWVEERDAVHPRKYYRLTAAGRSTLKEMLEVWTKFDEGMRQVIGTGVYD